MAPAGKTRRKRRPVPALKASAKVLDAEADRERSLLDAAPVNPAPEKTPPVPCRVVKNGTKDGDDDDCDRVVVPAPAAPVPPAKASPPPIRRAAAVAACAGFTTPTKAKPRAAPRAEHESGSSPPKIRTRSAKKAEAKITEFFRPSSSSSSSARIPDPLPVVEVDPLPAGTPSVNRSLFPSSPSSSSPTRTCGDNEEKENEAAVSVIYASIAASASGKPAGAVRLLNWEQEGDVPGAGSAMPPPHRIQSPLKPEALYENAVLVVARSTDAAATGSSLSPSSALNKLKISFDRPPSPESAAASVSVSVVVQNKMAGAGKGTGKGRRVGAAAKEAVGAGPQKSGAQQPTLEAFFAPVRRSSRKTKQELAKEAQLQIIQAIRSGKEDGLLVKVFPDKGRGVIAARPFAKGEFVVEYSGDLVDIKEAEQREAKYARDKNAGCYMYYFEHQNRQLCVDATKESGRLGRLINHSKSQANLSTKTLVVDGVPRLVLSAARDIRADEELLYDYGDRRKESLANHPWLAF